MIGYVDGSGQVFVRVSGNANYQVVTGQTTTMNPNDTGAQYDKVIAADDGNLYAISKENGVYVDNGDSWRAVTVDDGTTVSIFGDVVPCGDGFGSVYEREYGQWHVYSLNSSGKLVGKTLGIGSIGFEIRGLQKLDGKIHALTDDRLLVQENLVSYGVGHKDPTVSANKARQVVSDGPGRAKVVTVMGTKNSLKTYDVAENSFKDPSDLEEE